MAFTKTPSEDTYDTKRFPIVGPPQQRNGRDKLKDQRFLNCFVEQIKAQVAEGGKFYCKKRTGLKLMATPNLGQARAMIWEETTGKLFFVVSANLCVWDGVSVSVISPSINNISDEPIGFTIHLTTEIQVILLDGVKGWVINPFTNAVTQITDPDFPTPHVAAPVSLDGYLFVAKKDTADIYNSDLDDPLGWTAGNFITAEMYPDNVITMSKSNNYLCAIGASSIEYFYDAGNPSGSPLQRNDSAVQQFGTTSPWSVTHTEKEILLVGSTQNGGRTVWVIEGFKADEIGTEAVRQSLDDENAAIVDVNAYTIRIDGHKFYVLRLPFSERTWVYDFNLKLWHEWSTTKADNSQGVFIGKFAADSNFGYPYILGSQDGILYTLDDQTYSDDDKPILMQVTTLKLDFDNMNRKSMSRASLFGDWPLNTTTIVTLDWSDDDYRTWKGNRQIQLSQELPCTRRLGIFRRRAFRLSHTDSTPVRLEGMEVDINSGGS